MNHKSKGWNGIVAGMLVGLVATPAMGVEIVTREDLVNNVIKKEQLVKVADNGIFLLDMSSSMNKKFEDSGMSMADTMKEQLKSRNSYFPDLGHNIGVYTYTGWQENYPVQPYNRDKVAAALEGLRDKGSGPTPLKNGLLKLEEIVAPLPGRTAVFVFWDGAYTGQNPIEIAKRVASSHDVCFYVISSAKPERMESLKQNVASLNSCSRVIPLADFFNHPEYTSGALFDVKVTEEVVTTTESKIAGLKVDDINFATNETALSAGDKAELDELAAFMKDRQEAYAVIAGYTDNVGARNHNEGLSRSRAEMVARYLKEKHGLDDSRMVLFWYGPNNPKVPNTSAENQAANRRVEVNVGLSQT